MVRRAAQMLHAVILEPAGQVMRDVGRAIIAEQPGLVPDPGCRAA